MSERLLGNRARGLLFVISAPAGTGKTTLANMLKEEFSNQIISSISYTTRKPRAGEIPGVHYNYINKKEFEKRIADKQFLEYASLYGDYYGTSQQWVEEQLQKGKHLLLVIDTQGAAQLRAMQQKNLFQATFIFIMPPSLDVLKSRLEERKTETEVAIEKRLAIAQKEIGSSQLYDYRITNDDLATAYSILRSIIIAQTHHI